VTHVPRKRYGQHFLHDRGVIAKIVAAVDPQPGDAIVEVGPGTGALTGPLLDRVTRLEAIEIDRDLAARLEAEHPRLALHRGDVLRFDFARLPDRLRVVGNLPYNVSTPLLFRLVEVADRLRDAHLMLQKEVVDRMVAAPSTSEYGRLSVMLQYRFEMRKLFDVKPGAFRPPPKVDSGALSQSTARCARSWVDGSGRDGATAIASRVSAAAAGWRGSGKTPQDCCEPTPRRGPSWPTPRLSPCRP